MVFCMVYMQYILFHCARLKTDVYLKRGGSSRNSQVHTDVMSFERASAQQPVYLGKRIEIVWVNYFVVAEFGWCCNFKRMDRSGDIAFNGGG